jgi:hypothetical protein
MVCALDKRAESGMQSRILKEGCFRQGGFIAGIGGIAMANKNGDPLVRKGK